MRRAFRTVIVALGLAIASPAAAQSAPDSGRTTLRAFLDCRDGCDRDFHGPGAFASSQRLRLGDALVARSLGAHRSVGAGGSVVSNEVGNIEQATHLAGVVEWDLFPYEEFQRRRLTVLHTAGARASRYADRTRYGKEAETRPLHSLDATFNTRQLWGDVRLSVQGQQDLGERGFYRAGAGRRLGSSCHRGELTPLR